MKIKDGFIMRKIAEISVVVPIGESSIDFNGIITLNETAAFLFRQLQSDISRATLLEQLIDEYDVNQETAKVDVDAFCAQLEEVNLIE